MTFTIARTQPWPGYTFTQTKEAGLNVIELGTSNDLEKELNTLKKKISHIDVLATCITDNCSAAVIHTLSTLYPQCKLIANYGVGYNHIDIKAAHAAGIRVTNTPGVLTDSTADMALALLLMTTRRLFEGATLVAQTGRFAGWAPGFMLGQGIQNKTVGIVGFGEIGRAFAKRVEALGAKVVVLKTPWSTANEPWRLSENEFLESCDVISFHCKLTAQSRGWLNAERLARCKKGIVIVNTSRGEVIDESDLAAALHQGHVSAAGLDVFCNEPVLSEVLRSAPNLTIIPHLGTATHETRRAMSEIVVKNILAYAKGEMNLPNEIKF